MLTRSQVARRLGRSIATVRRLEDRALHPIVGKRNVRYFDVLEVDRLKQDPARLVSCAQSGWFKRKRASATRRASVPAAPEACAESAAEHRAFVASELEGLFEKLVEIPAARLLKAGLDEDAFAVLAAAIEALHKTD